MWVSFPITHPWLCSRGTLSQSDAPVPPSPTLSPNMSPFHLFLRLKPQAGRRGALPLRSVTRLLLILLQRAFLAAPWFSGTGGSM